MFDRSSAICLPAIVVITTLAGGCNVGSVATGETRNETVSFDVGESKSGRVEIRMGTGQLHVNSGTRKLMEGKFAYNVADWKPVVDYRAGINGELTVSQPNFTGSFGN